MTVKELIEELSKYPEDATVEYLSYHCADCIGDWTPIYEVEYEDGKGVGLL